MQVSVIVPTYKRPELLTRCLAALITQDFNAADYEIIVVDDAANLETRRLVESFSGQILASSFIPDESYPLSYPGITMDGDLVNTLNQQTMVVSVNTLSTIRYLGVEGNHGPAAARNAGWHAAQGEIIAFTDDDCLPLRDWLKQGVGALKPGVMGASGRVIVPLGKNPKDYEQDLAGLEKSLFITANCFYRREALEAVGGFDERFSRPWREDSDLFFTITEHGYTLVEAPQAMVVHPVHKARWGISLELQSKSFYNALLYKKHPELYWKFVQPSPPWNYYQILSLLGLSLVGWTGHLPVLGIIALISWLLLTLRFTAQRLRNTDKGISHILEMLITSMLIPPLAIYWRLAGAIKFRVVFL